MSLTGFSSCELTKQYETRGVVTRRTFHRYTYESRTRLYDVDIRDSDGDRTFHINMGFSTEPSKFHRAIEEHFSLGRR